jgi:hypothetical protein
MLQLDEAVNLHSGLDRDLNTRFHLASVGIPNKAPKIAASIRVVNSEKVSIYTPLPSTSLARSYFGVSSSWFTLFDRYFLLSGYIIIGT